MTFNPRADLGAELEYRRIRLARDAETKHDPSNGQFTSGGGGSGGSKPNHVSKTEESMKEHHGHLEGKGFSMIGKMSGGNKGAFQQYTKKTEGGAKQHRISVREGGGWEHQHETQKPFDKPGDYSNLTPFKSGSGAESLKQHLDKHF
jgi:hypothetical protein